MGTLRRATAADAAELTRLRGLMHLDMGASSLPDSWRLACEQAFAERLAGTDFVAFGVEVHGRLVSCGAGWLELHLPSPGQVDGRRGHIASISTEPASRRRGYGRQVVGALMDWMAEQDVPRVDLRATDDGRALYESFGFSVLGGSTMAWTKPGVTPGMPAR